MHCNQRLTDQETFKLYCFDKCRPTRRTVYISVCRVCLIEIVIIFNIDNNLYCFDTCRPTGHIFRGESRGGGALGAIAPSTQTVEYVENYIGKMD